MPLLEKRVCDVRMAVLCLCQYVCMCVYGEEGGEGEDVNK